MRRAVANQPERTGSTNARDRLTIRFPGVHIEGVGRGVNRVLMALAIVGAVMLIGLVLGRVL
jgi:hypothetical protein